MILEPRIKFCWSNNFDNGEPRVLSTAVRETSGGSTLGAGFAILSVLLVPEFM